MKYLIEGWLHHKNNIGIHLMKNNGLDIDFTCNYQKKYDCIINTSSFTSYQNFDGVSIYGPHISWWDNNYDNMKNMVFTKRQLFNVLSTPYVSLLSKIFLNLNFVALPFAVDVDKFCPKQKNGKPIIYYKGVDKQRLYDVINHLNDDFIIFNYQSGYNENDFLEAISTAPYAIWVGTHESQGFAFQETMSCNTPIFVVDVKSLREEVNSPLINFKPEINLEATSASYFNGDCGKISYPEIWKDDIENFLDNIKNYSPREFVINNLSPKSCCRIWNDTILNIIN